MRRIENDQTSLEYETGFGLIEVMLAVTVSSAGLLALAGMSLAVGSQGRMARWDTDRAVVARQSIERVTGSGFSAAASSSGQSTLGPRTYSLTQTVRAVSSRVKELSVRVVSAGRTPAVFSTRLAAPRPIPAAP